MKHNIGRIIIIIILVTAVIVLGVFVFKAAHDTNPVPVEPISASEVVPSPSSKPSISIPEPTSEPSVERETSQAEENYTKNETTPDADTAFILTINAEQVKVSYGVDEGTLKKTPGWLENSAYPGEDGVCVVYGHRNHLRALKDVELGDAIIIETGAIDFCYIIENIEIIDSKDELTISVLNGQYLMLTTCYPFYYSGSAPQKYVLTAKIIS